MRHGLVHLQQNPCVRETIGGPGATDMAVLLCLTARSSSLWAHPLRVTEIQEGRTDIIMFRTRAEKIFDLLRACTISKDEDHGRWLVEMLLENKTGKAQKVLEHNLATLRNFHSYLASVVQQRIDARAHSSQDLTASVLFVLTGVSALSAIPTLQPFLASFLEGVRPVTTLVTILRTLFIAIIVIGLIIAVFAVR